MEFVRLERPTPADFQQAAEICEERWPYLAPLHTPERFAAFARLGVELAVAREGGRLQGVCFVLPCRWQFAGETVEWVSLFQLATRLETKNIGALLMLRIMGMYPAIISMGVTDDATKMYLALKWKCYAEAWRGVHPLNLTRMAEDYRDRLTPRQRRLLPAAAHLYGGLSAAGEAVLSLGRPIGPIAGDAASRQKLALVAGYFPAGRSAGGVEYVNAGGIGRIVSPPPQWGGWRDHAAIWRQLRRDGAKFAELLIPAASWKSRALALGYAAVPMPVWYVDKNGMVEKFLAALRRGEISFAHNDKSI